jgi:hypothetical protein
MAGPNMFNQEKEKSAQSLIDDLKARMVAINPAFTSYFQEGKLVIPVKDIKGAQVSIGIGGELSGKREIELRLRF